MKKIINYFINNPIVAFTLILIVILLGVFSYPSLPITALPPLHVSNIEIDTYYQGGSPTFMEKSITTPLEQALYAVPNIETLSSQSEYSASFIHIVLKPKANLNQALQNIQSVISLSKDRLPNNVSSPRVSTNTGSDSDSLMIIGAYAPGANSLQVSQYIDRYIVPALTNIEGVARVSEKGDIKPAARVWLKPDLMHQYNITASEVLTAINGANVSTPGGLIQNKQKAFTLTVNARPETLEQLKNIIIRRSSQDSQIMLKDIANITISASNSATRVQVNGHPGVMLTIIPEIHANYLTVAQQIKAKLALMKPTFPPGLQIKPIIDSSYYIQSATHEIYKAIIEAAILVALVVLIFVGSIRLALIPMVTIPICLISSMVILKIMGYGINIMTLLALILSIGLIIDDAIVVLENTSRHMQRGLTAAEAAKSGTYEISFAIIAMTITLAVVYAPISLVSGFSGDLLKPFVFTLASLVILSGILSLTITPAMCKSLLPKQSDQQEKPQSRFIKLQQKYIHYLTLSLKFRWWLVAGFVIILMLGLFLLKALPKELLPMENYGSVKTELALPQNSSQHYIDQSLTDVGNVMESIPAQGNYLTTSDFGDHDYAAYYSLDPSFETHWNSQKIAQFLSAHLANKISYRAESSPYSLIQAQASGNNLRMNITAPISYLKLYQLTQQFLRHLNTMPAVRFPYSSLHFDNQEINVTIDKKQAADLGLSKQNIAQTISLFYGEEQANNKLMSNGIPYPIILSLPLKLKQNTGAFSMLWLKSVLTGNLVVASDIISTKNTASPYLLTHYNHIRSSIVEAKVNPGFDIQTTMKTISQYASNHFPNIASLNWSGGSLLFLKASHNLEILISLALLSIYLVLTLQFKSFIDPFIILLTVPLSFFGAIVALTLAGGSFNIYTQVGLLTLMGLITKHGILITDFANSARTQGLSINQAVIQAAKIRLRPILMTTLAMILGALPLAFLTGPGTNALHQMAWVIVGGMLCGSILSLFAVPIAYSLLARA